MVRAKDIFLDALELDRDERTRFLVDHCQGDTDLEAQVRGLLDAHERPETLIPTGGAIPMPTTGALPDYEPGAQIGPYQLIGVLGDGGFGQVWRAEQEEPVRRQVALKLLKAGLDTHQVLARFDAERQALAMMNHPCIARVLDGGRTDKGRPFFAMELVEGHPINIHCTKQNLSVRERIKLFIQVCRAVHHAHQKGIIHRDIKPSNVLVTQIDGRATPKVIDFGIAKAVEGRLLDASAQTMGGQIVGTPTYMSPEQLEAKPDIDTRTDVYSLGVLLYEILCDKTPFDETILRRGGLAESLRVLREDEPPRPSTRLSEGQTSVVTQRHVKGELDWIVMRCMEKDRERRYETVATLVADLVRFLRGEAVLAGPPSTWYRFSKFARRHRLALTSGVAFVVLLAVATIVSLGQAERALSAEDLASQEADRAKRELARSETVSSLLEHLLLGIDPAYAQGADTALLERILRNGEKIILDESDAEPLAVADMRRILGGAYLKLAKYPEAEAQLKIAVEIRSRELGDEDGDTLTSLEELGALYAEQYKYDKAEPFLKRAYRGRRTLLGDDDPYTRSARTNLATAYKFNGKLDLAVELLLLIEAEHIRDYGEDNEDTVRVMNNLAGALIEVGREDEAFERYEKALEWQLRVNRETHPNTLKAMNNLAFAYMEERMHAEALPWLERSLAVKRRIYSPGHPSLVIGLNNLANSLENLEREDEAEELYLEAIETSAQQLGDLDERTLSAQYNYGRYLLRFERLDEALDMLEGVHAGFVESIGDEKEKTIVTEATLAEAIFRDGDPEGAEPLAAHAYETALEILREGDPQLAVFLVRYGQILEALDRLDEAEKLLAEAYEILQYENLPKWTTRAIDALISSAKKRGDAEALELWRSRLP